MGSWSRGPATARRASAGMAAAWPVVAVLAALAGPGAARAQVPGPSCAVGLSHVSAPAGDGAPFATDGFGFAAQYWRYLAGWGALGMQLGWQRPGFDRGAFEASLDRANNGSLHSSSFGMTDFAGLIRLEPVAWCAWRPYLEAGYARVAWREKYSYQDLTPGPFFPSGVSIDVDQTLHAGGWMAGAGIRREGAAGWGVFAAAQRLAVDGDALRGRWWRVAAGVSWRP